jgi:rare lipoprotein A
MNSALLRRVLRLAGIAMICLALVACANRGGTQRAVAPGPKAPAIAKPPADMGDGPPLEAYDLSNVVEPTPKNEALARYGNHSPYTVLGKTYRLLPSRNGYVERGIASWYGRKFHGQLTSTREPYDMLALTAAHKTLPLPSYARVTNLANGASLIVRINDRGPFKDNRIIDLSYAAAVKLGVKQTGTALVEVRVIVPGEYPDTGPADTRVLAAGPAGPSPNPPPSVLPQEATSEPSIYLQVGAFSSRENAELLKRRLLSGSVFPAFVDQLDSAKGPIHRVRVGPLDTVELADELTDDIEALGLASPQIVIQ